jgi:hypothetical protein
MRMPPLPSAGSQNNLADGEERFGAYWHSYETPGGVADFHAAGRHSHVTGLLRNGETLV